MIGIGLGISKSKYTGTGGSGPARPTFFVDSVSGSDANDGLTSGTPFQTIGAVTLQDNMTINLARGSVFKETLSFTAFSGIIVSAYGTGQMPVIDCSEEAPASWVVDGVEPNVYNQTLTYEAGMPDHYPSIWEDGSRLLWVASKALCSATPGTFYTLDTDTSGSSEFSIHPYGSTNPTSDGKLYEYSARGYGIQSGINSVLNNIRTRRNLNNNGSTSLGLGGVANGCIFEDGVKHNFIAERNTTMNDCIAWKCDFPSRTQATAYVSFEVDASGGTTSYNRCISLFEDDKLQYAVDNASAILGIYAHTSGGPGMNWSLVSTTDCAFEGTSNGVEANDTDVFNSTRDYVHGGQEGIKCSSNINNVIDPYIRQRTDMSISMSRALNINSIFTSTIEGARVYTTRGSVGHVYTAATAGTLSISRSVFYRDEAPTFGNATLVAINGTINTSITNSILYGDRTGGSETFGYNINADPSTYNIDNNVMYTTPLLEMKVIIDGVEYWFEDYVVAYPTLDQNSIESDALFVDPANGDFNLMPGSPAIALGAGLARPNISYTVIPTHAEVEAM